MKGYSYSINKDLFSITFVNDTDEKHDRWEDRDKWAHYPILNRVLNFMKERGFNIGRDPRIQKYYKCLNKDHWYGRKGDLEFKAKRYPRGWEIEFFQNINYENKSGGYYDFNKFKIAPYLIRLMWIKETEYIEKFIESIVDNVTCDTKEDYKLAEEKVKYHFVDSWHKPQENMNFNLSDLDGTTVEERHNNEDRDKKTIYNGQVKYFRDYKGRLQRGKVYHNINNMWWVILNDTDYTNIADFELFDPIVKDFQFRRIQKNKKDSFETSSEAARKYFDKKALSYKDIKRKDVEKLRDFVGEEIKKFVKENKVLETMVIHPKIRTKCRTNSKIIKAFIYVDAHYFKKRECISFNENGFIGFAGWAGGANVRPMITGFIKWCDYLEGEVKGNGKANII
ncbi:hypothetical protein [Clostridium sp. HBUAS56017]|uniref:hypothetical protein n=1 Tax=Clostridium sp. HBUAS56017 TaxID=2571128 RepID=UPI0011787159|nr:hypothetical protein [Clostridium sp. HBUAS56017]